jgi:hypothetical protein
LNQLISHHRLRWLGHVLRMPTQRLPHRAMSALPGARLEEAARWTTYDLESKREENYS